MAYTNETAFCCTCDEKREMWCCYLTGGQQHWKKSVLAYVQNALFRGQTGSEEKYGSFGHVHTIHRSFWESSPIFFWHLKCRSDIFSRIRNRTAPSLHPQLRYQSCNVFAPFMHAADIARKPYGRAKEQVDDSQDSFVTSASSNKSPMFFYKNTSREVKGFGTYYRILCGKIPISKSIYLCGKPQKSPTFPEIPESLHSENDSISSWPLLKQLYWSPRYIRVFWLRSIRNLSLPSRRLLIRQL